MEYSIAKWNNYNTNNNHSIYKKNKIKRNMQFSMLKKCSNIYKKCNKLKNKIKKKDNKLLGKIEIKKKIERNKEY